VFTIFLIEFFDEFYRLDALLRYILQWRSIEFLVPRFKHEFASLPRDMRNAGGGTAGSRCRGDCPFGVGPAFVGSQVIADMQRLGVTTFENGESKALNLPRFLADAYRLLGKTGLMAAIIRLGVFAIGFAWNESSNALSDWKTARAKPPA
jgi:hypothetical protein